MAEYGLSESAHAEIRIGDLGEASEIILGALAPEAEMPSSTRSRVDLRSMGEDLVMSFDAEDTVALRASMNSYLRWVEGILEVFKRLGKPES